MAVNYFTILWWFLPYIHMNQPWVYMCSPSWTPSHLTPPPIPQGHPSAPALSTLSHASNLNWWSISHMIKYMFQCYSFKSSHPRLLPQSLKVCSLHLCLFCCLTYRVIITIFPNSIYMRNAFELWCWRRLLRVPWTARRSNQSILKETSPGCSLEGLMLRLKLQYFGHLMRRVDSLEKTLMLGGIRGRRRRGR